MLHPQDFEHHYVTLNGIRMHYAQAGQGPRLLVLLHGFPECWWSWRHQLALFRDTPALAARYTLIAPDLRGYNETDRPGWGYELDVLVQDVVELIRALAVHWNYTHEPEYATVDSAGGFAEAGLLKLNCDKALAAATGRAAGSCN